MIESGVRQRFLSECCKLRVPSHGDVHVLVSEIFLNVPINNLILLYTICTYMYTMNRLRKISIVRGVETPLPL